MELYKKLLERIENGEPIYCNKSFAKDLQTIADKHHKQLNIASVDSQRELLNCFNCANFLNNKDVDSPCLVCYNLTEHKAVL